MQLPVEIPRKQHFPFHSFPASSHKTVNQNHSQHFFYSTLEDCQKWERLLSKTNCHNQLFHINSNSMHFKKASHTFCLMLQILNTCSCIYMEHYLIIQHLMTLIPDGKTASAEMHWAWIGIRWYERCTCVINLSWCIHMGKSWLDDATINEWWMGYINCTMSDEWVCQLYIHCYQRNMQLCGTKYAVHQLSLGLPSIHNIPSI